MHSAQARAASRGTTLQPSIQRTELCKGVVYSAPLAGVLYVSSRVRVAVPPM